MSELHIRTALGFIEVVGLAAAVAAADAALKAANVSLVGREISKGYGYVTVKIAGDVGAVKAALAAAKAVSEKVSKVWSVDVIPRPASAIGPVLTFNRETQGASEWVAAHGPRETFSTAPEKEEKKSPFVPPSPSEERPSVAETEEAVPAPQGDGKGLPERTSIVEPEQQPSAPSETPEEGAGGDGQDDAREEPDSSALPHGEDTVEISEAPVNSPQPESTRETARRSKKRESKRNR